MLSGLLKKDGVAYFIVGCMTTLVNFIIFHVVDQGLLMAGLSGSLSYKAAYGIAFLGAVIFAYWTNKIWVFRNFNFSHSYLLREFSAFLAVRLLSGFASFALMVLLVDFIGLAHNPAWLSTTFINLIFNYVASKFWIFRKKGSGEKEIMKKTEGPEGMGCSEEKESLVDMGQGR